MSHGREPLPPLTAREVSLPEDHVLGRLPLAAGLVGALGLGLSFGLGADAPRGQLYFSYLVAFLFFLGIGLGALFFVLTQFAARAGWSVVVRRQAENLMATLPLFAVLFIPVLFGLHSLYHHWTDAAAVARDAALRHKSPWLNESFFIVRSFVYLVAWAAVALYYYRTSTRQDETAAPAATIRLERASPPALVIFAITVSFAAFDWIMSIDPHWYSTIFGLYFFAGGMVAAFATLVLVAQALEKTGALRLPLITAEHYHDLGKLLFGFTVFWAYIAFSQFMLIWYGDLPEETSFFARRWFLITDAGPWPPSTWRTVSVALAVGHFVVPFFFLLPRTVKRSGLGLTCGALWLLAMHYLDLYWLVMPNLHATGVRVHWLDLSTFVGVGGAFAGVFFWILGAHALLPVGDPRLPESRAFENT